MSIITMATSKGGAGKTTVAQMITGTVHRLGYSIGIIDTDPNGTLSHWLETTSTMAIECRYIKDETKIIEEARKLNRKYDLVLIDTPGTQSQSTLFSVSCANLVLIPVQLSNGDVIEASKTFDLVQSTGTLADRNICAKVIFTDYTPKTNIAKQARKKIRKLQLPTLNTRLHHLVAYKEMTFNGSIPKKGLAAEQGNLLVQEIFEMGHMPFMQDFKQAS